MNLSKNCAICRLDQKSGCKSPALLPFGSKSPKHIIVSSQPTVTDDNNKKLFSGSSGTNLKNILSDLGFDLKSVLFTAAVRCKPRKSTATIDEIGFCGETVRDLIEEHQPDSVVCLGDYAIRALFPKAYGIVFSSYSMRGSKVPYYTKAGKLVTVSVTYDPSILRSKGGEALEQVWYDDIATALVPIEMKVDLSCNLVICKTFAEVKKCSKKLKTENIVAWDYETTQLKPYGQAGVVAELFSVAFAFDDGTAYAIPLFNYFPSNMQKAIMEMVGEFFYSLNSAQRKIAHNTMFDMLWGLYKAGSKLEKAPLGIYEDTSLLCWMNDERFKMSNLKVAAWRYFGVDSWSVDIKNVRALPLDDVLKYNALDAFYTLRLYQHLEPMLCADTEGSRLYREVLIPAMKQFVKIEMCGVPVDEEARASFYKEYQKKLATTAAVIRKESGNLHLNPNSPTQLGDYFTRECKYKMLKRNATGWSTDEDSMQHLVDTYQDKVAAKVLEYRGLSKMQSTYIYGMSKHIYQDGHIHGGYNLTATVTGRTSCVSGDTKILTLEGYKNIVDIEEGEKVYTHHHNYQRVINTIYKGINPMVRVVFSSGYTLRCTLDHSLLTWNGQGSVWKSLRAILEGSLKDVVILGSQCLTQEAAKPPTFLSKLGFKEIKIEECHPCGSLDVYDITVENDESYYAAGVFSHNSSSPNMQNFPKRKNKEIRGIVVPPKGYKLCSFDYGQIEARLFAVLTADEQYLQDLYNGYDIHKEKALWIYRDNLGWSEEDAIKQRGAIKNGAVFPAFYGAGDYSISKNLGISQTLAHDFKLSIFNRYPKIKEWARDTAEREAITGVIKSLYGRKRRSPITYNELLNFTSQSTASDMTLTAMNLIGRKYKIAIMIHDDLSIFLPDDSTLDSNIKYICDAMLVLPWLFLKDSNLMKSYAPLQVECEMGDSWGDLKPNFTIDSVQAGYTTLDKCVERAEKVKTELMSIGW